MSLEAELNFLKNIAIPVIAGFPNIPYVLSTDEITLIVGKINGHQYGVKVTKNRIFPFIDQQKLTPYLCCNLENDIPMVIASAKSAAEKLQNPEALLTGIQIELKEKYPDWDYKTEDDILNVTIGEAEKQKYGLRLKCMDKCIYICPVLNNVPFVAIYDGDFGLSPGELARDDSKEVITYIGKIHKSLYLKALREKTLRTMETGYSCIVMHFPHAIRAEVGLKINDVHIFMDDGLYRIEKPDKIAFARDNSQAIIVINNMLA